MRYELRHYADEHFRELPDRKAREHAAETRLVELFFDGLTDGYYVDVGANDPKVSSQTWHLERLGWSGLLVEPLPELCARLRVERPRSTVVQVACGAPDQEGSADFFVAASSALSTLTTNLLDTRTPVRRVERVRVLTLDRILEDHPLPRVDYLSIDVEGLQLEVLRGFTLSRHRPRLLQIEDHLTNFRTHRFLTRQGYALVKRTGVNNWYIPRGTPFHLTSPGEQLKLWRKLWLGTPVRRLRFALRKRLHRG